ncbi:M48 family metalloprotease [Nostoc sp. CHAB 5834]|nr:M48 family metalloprotease [Nostoc sp. CHAB 5834]
MVERIHKVSTISPNVRIKVTAYKHPKINAHAADHGALLFTEGTWSTENGLSMEEIAAIVAHELAHMEMDHSLDWACGALTQLGNPELTLQQAIDELGMELFNSSSPLASDVRKRFHQREMLADTRAVSLMAAAGFDSTAVASVLLKLHQLNPNPGSTLSAGTHPDLVVKAQAAVVAQTKVLQANIQ